MGAPVGVPVSYREISEPQNSALTGPRRSAGGPFRSNTTVSFDHLGLAPELVRVVADQGYTEPTPV